MFVTPQSGDALWRARGWVLVVRAIHNEWSDGWNFVSCVRTLLLICFLPIVTVAQDGGAQPLTSIVAVNRLSEAKLADELPVKLSGIVVSVEPRSERVVLVAEGQSLVARLPEFWPRPRSGEALEVEGFTTTGGLASVKLKSFQTVDPKAVRPQPRKVTPTEALEASSGNAWMEVSGFTQMALTNYPSPVTFLHGRVSLQLREGDRVLHVIAPQNPLRIRSRLRLSEIKIRGVSLVAETKPRTRERILWVESWDEIDVLKEGPPDPFGREAFDLEQIDKPEAMTGIEPVRLRGRIVEVINRQKFRLARSHGVQAAKILCRQSVSRLIRKGDVIDLLGYPLQDKPGGVNFDVVDMRWLGLREPTTQEEKDVATLSDFVPRATSVRGIRELTGGLLDGGWPVRLFGVATHRDEAKRSFYLQAGQGYGVRVRWPSTNALPAERDFVFLSGLARSDISQTTVRAERVEILGHRSQLDPRRPTASAFASGEFTHGLVALNGVVRAVERLEKRRARLTLEFQGDLVRVEIPLHGNKQLPQRLVGAEINVRGIAIARKSAQLSYPEEILMTSGPAALKVLDRPPNDLFGMPSVPVESVLQNPWRKPNIRLLRLEGTVTALSNRRILMDDGTGGITLHLRSMPEISPGDEISAVGFPVASRIAPHLAAVKIRRLGKGELPPPNILAAKEVLTAEVNGRRIRTRGRIVDTLNGPHAQFELRAGDDRKFSAALPMRASDELVDRWPIGSEIELTGVCQYLGGGGRLSSPESFRVFLNGPADITTLSQPPWWNAERLALASGAMALLVIAALGWANFFRNRARQNRSQFLTTFHASPMPAWIIRRQDRRCIEVNGEFEELFGITRAEFVEHSMQQVKLWRSDEERQSFLDRVAENPSLRAIEAKLQHRDGHLRHVLLSAEPIMVGKDECLLLNAYDITERLKLLEQLRQAQKMEAVGQLAAGVAHDFNNLLTVVRGNSGLIRLKDNLDDDTCILTREIEDAGSRAAELTGQLLAFSRKSVMNRRVIDMNDVVRSAGGMLKRVMEESIEVSYCCTEEPLPVKADSGMIDQVLLNMGVNSRDAMPHGGRFTIDTSWAEFTSDNLPANPDSSPGRYAVLEVSDNGTGMGAEVCERVFEPFFTTKDVGKGTGLGLSTAYGILRQHGGWIDLDSEPERGTTFTIYLPLTDAVKRNGNGEMPSDILDRGNETILVVEDETSVRKTVQRTLKHHGYTVLEAESGPAAEALWQNSGSQIDLMLTDLMMPNGMTGFDVARRFHEDRPDLKVIYMTGHSQELVEHGGRLVAGVDFLPKPFEHRDLVRIIRKRLDAGKSTSKTDG